MSAPTASVDAVAAPVAAPAAEPVDLRHPDFRDDPHRRWRALRPCGPVLRDTLGAWLVVGHAEARTVLTDAQLSRDPRLWRGYAAVRPFLADSTLEQAAHRWMILNDPPVHTRMRRMIAAAFTPAATRAMQARVEAAADALIARLPDGGEFDLVRDFAQPFPVRVIGDMLGLPDEDFARGKAWSDALALVFEPVASRESRRASDRAAAEMTAWLREQVARHRRAPGDALLDAMVRAQEADGGCDDDELLANLMLLFAAGHETTTNLIGNGMATLLAHPEATGRLRADPSRLPAAIEEMLRFEGPVNVVARVTRAPYRIGGHEIGAGEALYAMVGAAGRDPRAFADPDVFDIGRDPNPHLAFGGGIHYCVGAPLAQLEGRVAFDRLLARFPRLRRTDGPLQWRPLLNLRGLAALPVRG
jgi:cytochrome P450